MILTCARTVPEPILTHALSPYFEVAMSRETRYIDEKAAPTRIVSGKEPKPSSRRPPSQNLLNAFPSLLARLPQENRGLLHTVIGLINVVA